MRFILSIRSLLFALVLLAISAASSAQISVGVSIRIAPPELPIYEQPICPEDGYLWTPGYWAYGDEDYYWVPGTWVAPPEVGYLWTPGYWGGDGDHYIFHEGYWGTEVGFYGGISYGYGYFGHGYEGGRWDNGHFAYNQSVSRVNVSINRNVYNTRVEDNNRENRVSFNGGNGGVQVRASAHEEAAGRERHIAPVAAQTQHVESARANPELRASANHGKPPIAATEKPGAFRGSGAVAAREGGAVHTAPPASANNNARPNNQTNRPSNETARPNEANRPAVEASHPNADSNRPSSETTRPSPAVHARDLPPAERVAPPNTGNARQDQKYQQQQQKLQTQQVNERQKLQTRQEQDHNRLPQQPANAQRQQQLEQQHQQQTQQLSQKHTQQQQQMQQRQQSAARQNAPKQEKPKPAGE
jgi:hypothetical protein